MKSFRGTWTIACNTLTELVRMRIFYFLMLLALFMIGSSAFVAQFAFQEQFQMLKDISLGVISIFTSLLAILSTANFLPKDIEDRTIYTVLAKPISRASYLLGKLLGIFLLLTLATFLMSGLFLAILWLQEHNVLAETRTQFQGHSPEELALALKEVTQSTFNANLFPGIVIILVKSALLASMTLFLSTFASSSLFGILTAIAIYFIAHLQGIAREYWLSSGGASWWSRILTAIVALLFPDLQAFNFADDITAGVAVPTELFLQTVALGGLYVIVYFLLAIVVFSERQL